MSATAFCLLGPFGSNAQCLRATLFRAMATFAVSAFGSAYPLANASEVKSPAEKKALAEQSIINVQADFNLRLRFLVDSNSPVSSRLAARVLGQEVQLALFRHQIVVEGKRFEVRYRLSMPTAAAAVSGFDFVDRSGQGLITAQGLQGQRLVERRGTSGDVYEVRLQSDARTVTFNKNQKKTKEESISSVHTDLTSLPYFWLGKPVKAERVRIDVIDTKKVYRETFVGRNTTAKFQAQMIKAVQFDKVKQTPDDADLSILVRESDGFPLRVDLGLNSKYGITALMFPQTIPSATIRFPGR